MNKLPFILLATLLPIPLSAAILNPYVVEEKPQVLFGDSASIPPFLGLENYNFEYVDGYAHITFTYTHSKCCYANFPPLLYITNVDPRATTTPVVRTTHWLLHLDTSYPTGWYKYNIQFDETGFTTVVKESDITEVFSEHVNVPNSAAADWVALANYYPPNFIYAFAFTPKTIRENVPSERTPVIIIPGIMGSYLNKEDGTEVWMNLPKMAFPGSDSYLDDLGLNDNGETVINLEATDIIDKTGSEDFFNSLVTLLNNYGYKNDSDLFVFPYDWRLDVSSSSSMLQTKIQQIKEKTGSDKVDVIAHSMGGLLIKEYIKTYNGNFINKFIDIGTPHNGSPKSYKILTYGDNLNASILFGLVGLNSERIKIVSQNMPSVYQLLPNSSYGGYLYDMDDLDENSEKGLLSYSETKTFMKNTGRNSLLVDRAESFHQELDNLNPSDYGVETYNITGCGIPTLDKIFILNKENSGGVEYNISFANGDGTVPLKSAEVLPAIKTYYAKNTQHALMPSAAGIKDLIVDILGAEDINAIDISNYSNIASSDNNCKIPNGRVVSFHSPIDLHIYDNQGNHVGPNSNGDIENNIPGIGYEIIDGNKFAFLPDGIDYVIEGKATGAGTFNARVQKIEDERVVETLYFNSVSLTAITEVEVNINTISLDNNADGVIDLEVQPSAVLGESQSVDIVKPVTFAIVEGKKKDRYDPFNKPVKISFSAIDDNSGVLKTEYSLNNAFSWLVYLEPFTISTKGENRILYRSTDKAGNVESQKTATIIINPPGNSGKK